MNRIKHSERGQSALLAVVGLVLLAIGMYTAYSLSRAVYEKIQLQNAADATAYSLGTLEARAFNFIAFANRAQVANHVQILEAQSLVSSASYVEATVAHAGDMVESASGWCTGVPLIGVACQAAYDAGKGLEATYDTLKAQVDTLDDVVATYTKLETTQNQALYVVSLGLALATALELGSGGEAVAHANDPDAELSALSWALNGLNVASYVSAFDTTSYGGLDFAANASDADKQAQRLLAEIVNASRYGSGTPRFVVDRPRFAYLQEVLGPLIGKAGDSRAGQKLDETLNTLMGAAFKGTTKLVTDKGALPDWEVTGEQAADASFLARGGGIVAKDKTLLWTQGVGLRITPRGSEHCRYRKPSSYGSNPLRVALMFSPEVECQSEGGKHDWKNLLGMQAGLTRYVRFAAKAGGIGAEQKSFNQPDVWVLLSKSPEAIDSGHDLNFKLSQGGDTASFDGRIGAQGVLGSGFAPGMHAIARAQVYYHRPGAWQEPPNFFNPYWSARLAPKNAAIKRVFEEVGLGGVVAQLVGDNLWMH